MSIWCYEHEPCNCTEMSVYAKKGYVDAEFLSDRQRLTNLEMDSIKIPVVASLPESASTGEMVLFLNENTLRLYVYFNNAWHYVNLT